MAGTPLPFVGASRELPSGYMHCKGYQTILPGY